MNDIIPIILCGGSGSRLFPLSRKNIPKQFLYLQNNQHSLLQNTVLRLLQNKNIREIAFVSNILYYNILIHQIKSLNLHVTVKYFFEPSSRNTCPAIGFILQYYYLYHSFTGRLLFLPSDHIYDHSEFNSMMSDLQFNHHTNDVCTIFGIKPTYPDTGFGYIEFKNQKVLSFKEKPDLKTAELYLQSDRYCWNSGMFVFTKDIIESYKYFNERTFDIIRQILMNNYKKDENCIIIDDLYKQCEDISIDYALIEKIPDKMNFYLYKGVWSDIGSFFSLVPYSDDYLAFNSHNNYVNTTKKVILNDISDAGIIETDDLILITNIHKSQEIKQIFNSIPADFQFNTFIDYRPWGFYQVLNNFDNMKSKRITVYPHKRLSLQSHTQRCEHWICLQGKGRAQINDDFIELFPNKQVFINFNDKHRLINDNEDDLVIIEIQTGTYFGEDDIIRYEDDYGRI